ncbi:MAG: hypothetical protein KGN30_09875, partial [Nitrospirota bacterium]|nr:hypothetical protein [Nitrospirota bacterium]
YRRFETREIGEVRGLARVQPLTAVALLVAGLALVGMPPFSLFASEMLVVSALATQRFDSNTLHVGQFVAIVVSDEVRSLSIVAVFLAFAVALFGGFIYRLSAMTWGTPLDHIKRGEGRDVGHVPLVVTALLLVTLGVALPEGLKTLLDRATTVLLVR